jgi:hypothetical protein
MKRRNFIKSGMGIILLSHTIGGFSFNRIIPQKETYIDPDKWFNDNFYWLKDWLDNSEMSKSPKYKGFQHFLTEWKQGQDINPFNQFIITQEYKNEHSIEILRHAVFSKKARIRRQNPWSGFTEDLYFMSGFIEQKGRYPTKRDRAIFEYWDKYWLHSPPHLRVGHDMIITHCKLKTL